MPLLNEGTNVCRPVIAHIVGNNVYNIVGTIQGELPEDLDEEWLFPVGSNVMCRISKKDGDEILIVNKLYSTSL